jgi:predicted Ser/Thr protein kinase
MQIVAEDEYTRRFEAYFRHLVAQTRHEMVRDAATGRLVEPDVKLLESVERQLPVHGPADEWRRGLVSRIGAYAVENPSQRPIDFGKLFPDLLRPLRQRFFDDRRAAVTKVQRNLLLFGAPEFGDLPEPERRLAERTLDNLTRAKGYCGVCAKDAVDLALARLAEET